MASDIVDQHRGADKAGAGADCSARWETRSHSVHTICPLFCAYSNHFCFGSGFEGGGGVGVVFGWGKLEARLGHILR